MNICGKLHNSVFMKCYSLLLVLTFSDIQSLAFYYIFFLFERSTALLQDGGRDARHICEAVCFTVLLKFGNCSSTETWETQLKS